MLDGTQINSGDEVDTGTVLTLENTPMPGYKFLTYTVNGNVIEGNTVTVNGPTEIDAMFLAVDADGYVIPAGTTSAKGKGADYIKTVTVTGAVNDVTISRSAANELYELCNGEGETIDLYPGTDFSMHFLANYTSTTTNAAPDPEDLRYTKAFVFADWNADGEFELVGKYGYGASETGFGGNVAANYATVLDFTQNFSVPADAAIAKSRIRVIYTSAWTKNSVDVDHGADIPGDFQEIQGGHCFDYVVNVVNEPEYTVTLGNTENGTLKVYTDADMNNEVTPGSTLKATQLTDGLYFKTEANENYELQSLKVNEANVTEQMADGVYHLATVTADVTAEAEFALKKFAVTFDEVVNGTITVTCNGEPVENADRLPYGSVLTFANDPDAGYALTNYIVGGEAYTESTLTLTDDVTIGALFTLQSFPVSAGEITTGGVTVNKKDGEPIVGTDPIPYGTELTLEADEVEGYDFAYFTVNGEKIEGKTVIVKGETKIGVVYAIKTFTLTIPEVANGAIVVKNGEDVLANGAVVEWGTKLTYEFVPEEGYEVETSTVNEKAAEAGELTVKENVVFGATFAQLMYTLTIPEVEHGSIVVKDGETVLANGVQVVWGTELTYEFVPEEGYKVETSTVNEKAAEAGELTVKEDVVFGATFAQLMYTLTIPEVEHGSIVVKDGETVLANGVQVAWGTEVTYEFVPEEGYKVETSTVNEEAAEAGELIVKKDVVFGATFAQLMYTLTIPEVAHGTIVVKDGETVLANGVKVAWGTEVAYEFVPEEGYKVETSTVNEKAAEAGELTVKEDVVFGASFVIKTFTLTIPTVEHGSIVVKNGETVLANGAVVEWGTKLTYEFVAEEGYKVATTTVNGEAAEAGELTVESDVVFGATFAQQTFTLTIPEVAHGAIVVKDGETVLANGVQVAWGTELTYEFVPEEGYKVNTSTVNEEAAEAGTLIVKKDVTFGATFVIKTFTLTIPTVEHGSIVVKDGETVLANGAVVEWGTKLTYEFVAEEGYKVETSTVNEEAAEAGELTVKEDVVFGATFAQQMFTVTIPEVENGTIVVKNGDVVVESGEEVAWGTVLTYEAVPVEGYELESYLVNDEATEATTLTVTGDVKVAATFAKIPTLVVTLATEGEGTLKAYTDAYLSNEVESGAELKVRDLDEGLYFQVAAAKGYKFESLTVNGKDVTEEVEADGVYRLAKVEADVNVVATFAEIVVPFYLGATDGPVEVYADEDLTILLASHNGKDDELETTLKEKDCPDGLWVVLHQSNVLKLVKFIINGSDFASQVEGNIFHIEDVTKIPYYDEVSYVSIWPYYEIDELQSLKEIGIDVNEGNVEFYNLQGVKVATENVRNGYYIVRQGNKTVKVLIK